MRFLFALTGFLFDVVMLSAACFAIYCVVQPDMLYFAVNLVTDQFETGVGRLQVGGGAIVLLVLSLRGLFLLMFRGGDSHFVIKRDDKGTLSVSRSTLERLVNGIAAEMHPPAAVVSLRIVQQDSGLRIDMKISLDMVKCSLTEYSDKLNSSVKTYFQESLGVPVAEINVQASAALPDDAVSKPGVSE